jgi:hypothetical protein
MALGQINPLNFVVAQRLASNQNVDSSAATRHALVGTLLGEGILGPIIARQLAIRDAAAVPAPVAVVPGATLPPTPLDTIASNLNAWTTAESKRDDEDIDRANALRKQAEERRAKRTEALRSLCDSLGALGSGEAHAAAEEAVPAGARKKPG